MNLFKCLDYKSYIRFQVRLNQKRHGYRSRLAEAAGCQKSFFSKAMTGPTHLTAEHAAGLVAFWNLPEVESEYFIALVNLERAGSPQLKVRIERQLQRLRQDQNDLAKRFGEATSISTEHAQIYYSNWLYLAVHYLLSIPKFQTVEEIARRLQCTEELVLQVLGFLRDMGVVEARGSKWQMNGRDYHLPRTSEFTQMNHSNWRARAVQNSFEKNDRDIHYTSVGSISLADVDKLRQLTMEYIDKGRATVGASGTEELFCMSVDFFRV